MHVVTTRHICHNGTNSNSSYNSSSFIIPKTYFKIVKFQVQALKFGELNLSIQRKPKQISFI